LTWNVALEQGGWLVGREITIDMDLVVVELVAAGAPEGERAVAGVS
jgi:hypothetical protein